MEAPDVTGSSLTLGAAGSRRTVYLIDENQKIPEAADGSGGAAEVSSGSSSSSTATLSGKNSMGEVQTSTSSQKPENQATFLMYNRINNIIGGNSPNFSSNEISTSGFATSSGNSSRDIETNQEESKLVRSKRAEDKNNSIWYEYGCV